MAVEVIDALTHTYIDVLPGTRHSSTHHAWHLPANKFAWAMNQCDTDEPLETDYIITRQRYKMRLHQYWLWIASVLAEI